MPTSDEKLHLFIRISIAYMLMFFLFTLNLISFSTPLYVVIDIPFVYAVLYYWAIYRPSLLPPFVVFVFGLIFDLIIGLPVGLSAFVMLIVRQLVADQRLFLTGQPFTVIWLGFAIVSGVALSVHWALYGLVQLQWTPFLPVAVKIICGIFIFPAVVLILHLTHKLLPIVVDQYSAVK